MRRGLFFVLMVVLVLRGLTGTAMAAGILQPLAAQMATPVAAPSAAHEHAKHDAQDHGDHATHAAHAQADSLTTATSHCADGGDCGAHEHGSTCSACEICHSAMLDAPMAGTPALPLSGALQPAPIARFDSAPAALAIKPPIA